MGPKITIDSATMMNKGLEIIEAHFLFGLPPERIAVVLHPQSVIHSFVEFADGSLIAQLAKNDMKFPIVYAMTWPDRLENSFGRLDLVAVKKLEFFDVEPERYPAVELALDALRQGGGMPAVVNGANEVAVAAFLAGEDFVPRDRFGRLRDHLGGRARAGSGDPRGGGGHRSHGAAQGFGSDSPPLAGRGRQLNRRPHLS